MFRYNPDPEIRNCIDGFEEAICQGRIEDVNEFLNRDLAQNYLAIYGCRVLAHAVYYGHLDIVKRLLEFPKMVDQIADWDNELLYDAASEGYLDILNFLLGFSIVRDKIAICSNKVFNVAYSSGNKDIWMRLLDFEEVRKAVLDKENLDQNLYAIVQKKESEMNLQKQSLINFPGHAYEKAENVIIEADTIMNQSKALLFSDATESSSSSAPNIEEEIKDLQLDASNESLSSNALRKKF